MAEPAPAVLCLTASGQPVANQIAAASQWSTRAIKRMINGLQSGWADSEREALDLFLEGFSNEDFADGYKAFLEKRPPNFTFR